MLEDFCGPQTWGPRKSGTHIRTEVRVARWRSPGHLATMLGVMKGRFTGSCLCGAVSFAFDSEPRLTVACHCSQCRKATGSAFGVWTLVDQDSFRWTAGAEQIAERASSEHGQRLFCKCCGATLGNLTSRRPRFIHLAAGTLDNAPALRIAFHAYVASKADWYDIADGIPQHDEEPTQRG